MAHEELIYEYAQALRVFDKHTLAEALGKRSPWRGKVSKINNTYKACMNLVANRKLEQCDGFFRVNYCRADWNNPHTQELTRCLSALLALPHDVKVYREILVQNIGLRSDGIAFIKKEHKARCCILEVCLTETKEYLESKINAWHGWEFAKKYLSQFCGVRVPYFDIVVYGMIHPKAIPFEEFMEEVK